MSPNQTPMTLPDVTLEHSHGGRLQIPDDLRNGWTILYFYPKDDTPGCTKQACTYRDHIQAFTDLGVGVYGVSMDDLGSHDAFKEKFQLNFPLLADTQGILSQSLGVYGDQEWRGQVFKGLSRDTFLIGPGAKIVKIWRKVDPTTTVEETLEEVRKHLGT